MNQNHSNFNSPSSVSKHIVTVDLPLLTADLPGTGGQLQGPEDFIVEEIPAYLPEGKGEHCFAFIQKQRLTTPQAISKICNAFGLSSAEAGYAGLKDKEGITRQWISLTKVKPEELLTFQEPDLQVLQAGWHRNKLRTGHLRGNRFTITLHDTYVDAFPRAQQVLARLTTEGLPNFYGEQRFGRAGDNAQTGLRIVRGEVPWPRDRFKRRLLLSSIQSFLFNQVLARRLENHTVHQLLGGEVLQRTDTSGMFVSEDQETDARRLAQGEVVITGPMCGPRMPLPKENSPARQLEEEIFDAHGIMPQSFAAFGRLARGGRRPLTVPVAEASVSNLSDGHGLVLHFALPAGSYATVLLREVTKIC